LGRIVLLSLTATPFKAACFRGSEFSLLGIPEALEIADKGR
jgi:hypothetical protein